MANTTPTYSDDEIAGCRAAWRALCEAERKNPFGCFDDLIDAVDAFPSKLVDRIVNERDDA